MSRFCVKKSDCCEPEPEDDGATYLGHYDKWRLEYELGSIWIVDTATSSEYFWSLDEFEKDSIDALDDVARNAILEGFRLAVSRKLMDCPEDSLWLLDENIDRVDKRVFLGHYYVHRVRGRCTWPIGSDCYSELVNESLRRASFIGIDVSEKKVKIPIAPIGYKELGHWGNWNLRYYYDRGHVSADAIVCPVKGYSCVSYKFGDDVSKFQFEAINALFEAVRSAVSCRLMVCPPEYKWMLSANPWAYNGSNQDYIWLGRNANGFCCAWKYTSFPIDELSICRVKMLGFCKEPELEQTITIYNPGIELLRELYNFGHWTVNDRMYGEQIEIWERVRQLLIDAGGTKG